VDVFYGVGLSDVDYSRGVWSALAQVVRWAVWFWATNLNSVQKGLFIAGLLKHSNTSTSYMITPKKVRNHPHFITQRPASRHTHLTMHDQLTRHDLYLLPSSIGKTQ
jgi:hypothetical protein